MFFSDGWYAAGMFGSPSGLPIQASSWSPSRCIGVFFFLLTNNLMKCGTNFPLTPIIDNVAEVERCGLWSLQWACLGRSKCSLFHFVVIPVSPFNVFIWRPIHTAYAENCWTDQKLHNLDFYSNFSVVNYWESFS